MSEQGNKDVVARLTRELYNDGGDLDVVEELIAPDFVDHTRGDSRGPQSYRARAEMMRGPFSNLRTTSDELVAEGDTVFERFTSRFDHTGEFMGIPPSGESVELIGFAEYRLRDGQVTEFWGLSDELTLMEKIGALN